jgi:hypothetical protein
MSAFHDENIRRFDAAVDYTFSVSGASMAAANSMANERMGSASMRRSAMQCRVMPSRIVFGLVDYSHAGARFSTMRYCEMTLSIIYKIRL